MPKVVFIVDPEDNVSDLVDALKCLNAHRVSIDKETQINNSFLPARSLIAPFEGTTDEVIALFVERAKACGGELNTTHFTCQTTVTLEN